MWIIAIAMSTRCAFIVYSSWVQMGFANRREAKTIPVDALEGFPIVALHRTFDPSCEALLA